MEGLPVTFRDDQLYQVVNDLGEEDSGKGYSQITRTGAFVTTITVWETSAMLKKRTLSTITRTGPFVSSVVKQTYAEDDGVAVISTITATLTRALNNTVTFVNVAVTRP